MKLKLVHREAENGVVIKIIGQGEWAKNGVWETSFSRQPLGLLETWTRKGRIGLYSYGYCSCCLDLESDVVLLDLQSCA